MTLVSTLHRPIVNTVAVVLVLALAGPAGAACNGDICGGGTTCTVPNGTYLVDSGCVLGWGGKDVTIDDNATLKSAVAGGSFTIEVRSLFHEGRLESDGGAIGIHATSSVTTLLGSTIDLDAESGGALTITAHDDVTLQGRITSIGNPTIDDVDGNGGDVTVTAVNGSLIVAGAIDVRGGSAVVIDEDGDPSATTGAGGAIELSAKVDSTVSGDLTTKGSADDGGEVSILAGRNINVSGDIETDATRFVDTGLDGGAIAIEAGGSIGISGRMSTMGLEGTGGDVGIDGGADVYLSGRVTANGRDVGASGGDIVVTAGGNVHILSLLESDGTNGPHDPDDNEADAAAGNISVDVSGNGGITVDDAGTLEAIGIDGDGTISAGPACAVVVDGTLDTRGPTLDGTTEVFYRNSFSGAGTMRAGAGAGLIGNFIKCRSSLGGSCVTAPSNVSCDVGTHVCVSGAMTLVPNASLAPVALAPCSGGCGNAALDPGEECDDGNTAPCDGCSPTCKLQGNDSACSTSPCLAGGVCHCTTPGCSPPGSCSGATTVTCEDGNACTDDSPTCDPQTGCTHTVHICHDHDPTTIDSCDVVTGCLYRHALAPSEAAALATVLNLLLDPCAGDSIACTAGASSCTALTVAAQPRLAISKLRPPGGDEKLKLSGRASFGALQPALDFVGKGLRLIISDAARPIVDVTVPGGALNGVPGRGWVSSPDPNPVKWKYVDRTVSPLGGITKIAITIGGNGVVTFSLQGTGDYPLAAAALPLTAILVLDPTAESTNQCSYLSFPAPERACRRNGSGTTLKCK